MHHMDSGRPSTASGNRTLASAKAAKQDEFYTQLADIENAAIVGAMRV